MERREETSAEAAATFERVFDDAGASVARLAPRWFELVADFARHLGRGNEDGSVSAGGGDRKTAVAASASDGDQKVASDDGVSLRCAFRDLAVAWRPALEAFTAAAASGAVAPSDVPSNAADVVCSLARAATCRSLTLAGRDSDWSSRRDFDDDDDAVVADSRRLDLDEGAPSDEQAALAARATRRVLAASGRGAFFDADPSVAAAAVASVTAAISAGVGGAPSSPTPPRY